MPPAAGSTSFSGDSISPEAPHRLFETYSAGMRQKMAIARGLVSEPAVLFMDEPTRALDPISAREVRDLVAEYVVGELHRPWFWRRTRCERPRSSATGSS